MLYCDRDSADRRQHLVLQHVRDLRGATRRAESAHRGPARSSTTAPTTAAATSAPACTATGRSAHRSGRAPSARLHASGDRPAHALSRPPAQCLYRWDSSWRSPRRCSTICGAMLTRPEFAWEHVWRVGDLVLWDNRCTMHRRDAVRCRSRGGSCIAPRSRATPRRRDRTAGVPPASYPIKSARDARGPP